MAFAQASTGVPQGESSELDEFPRKDKLTMVRAAWAAVVALEKRLAAGWDTAAQGRHPDNGCWMSVADLLWGLAHAAITPRDINRHLPVVRLWPAELVDHVARPDGTLPHFAKQALNRRLVGQLWPTSLDLHAFRILLMDATGHAPEEVSALRENDVEFVPGGVRLTLVKLRARRRSHRSFRDTSPSEVADVGEAEEFRDRPRREPGVIVRRLMAVTENARLRAADPEGKLFSRACMENDLTLRFSEWNPESPRARFGEWLRQNQITVSGDPDIRRLRKSTKVEKVVAARGHIADAADDHYEETFRGHYAQGTTLRVISGEVINAAQDHWFQQALDGPTMLTAQAAEDTTTLQALGLTEQQADKLIQGELDMGITHCKDPYDSPFSPAGELCSVAPLRCLECRNAWVLPSQLPQLLLFRDHLDRVRQRLTPVQFTGLWGQSYANLRAVLDDRSDEEITLARKHIAEAGIRVSLPLNAHVEFDT
ncbi:hypothetical protein AB0K05_38165 [Nonomuraea sp. NPDC049486]|uniref:hypothetical protein n=1 Tax=Nonomuraea sp. NPDC049486 TaxID=3155773 RepID=UPI0034276544